MATPEALAQLAQVLQGTLSADQAARAAAEQALRDFAPQPRFACVLTVLAVGEEAAAPLHLRRRELLQDDQRVLRPLRLVVARAHLYHLRHLAADLLSLSGAGVISVRCRIFAAILFRYMS